eukprot:Phypoly_transcript_09274.p1 GENE.Phypoly_transcript_09274~~Phypoly_transcript_09274.p1  ORF type:complete len:446 (+),score=116.32 Phypoly_transcript_09274:66-1403(+)
MEPSKKRTFSSRQLESVLDGGYWNVSPGGRAKKSTTTSSFTNTTKSSPTAKTNSSRQNSIPDTNTNSQIKSFSPPHDTTKNENFPLSDMTHTHISTPSHTGPQTPTTPTEPTLSTPTHSYDIPFTTQYSDSPTTYPEADTTTAFTSSSSSLPFSSPNPPPLSHSAVPPPPPLPTHPHKIKTETLQKAPEKESEKAQKANVELDGSYWASFDSGIKRKKERVLADLTTVDSDYWIKRNARAQVPKKPTQPLTDEQRAKRAEKLARSREEHEAEQQEAHERILRKQEDARMGKEVFPGVFLGSKHAAKNWEFFEKHKICGVVNVTSEVPNYHQDKGSVTYMKIPVSDLPTVDLLETFEKIAGSIHELTQKGNILIHCKEGKSRSPTFCMAFAMKYLAMQLADAHQSIVNKSEIRINLGFQQQLMSYERRVFNTEYNSFNFLQKRKAL